MIGGAGSRHRRRRSSPGVHFAQAQQVARLAALNQRDINGGGADDGTGDMLLGGSSADHQAALARRRSSKFMNTTAVAVALTSETSGRTG